MLTKVVVVSVTVAVIFASLSGLYVWSLPASGFQRLGHYYISETGPTSIFVRMPDSSGVHKDWLSWGYDIWGLGTEPPPPRGWVTTESLYNPPYNLPRDTKAVRLHIKAKVAIVSWAANQVSGALQVSARPAGLIGEPNEIIHAYAEKLADEEGATPYDLAHVETDVKLGHDGKIDILRDASIVGDYAQIDLVVYLAGYWR